MSDGPQDEIPSPSAADAAAPAEAGADTFAEYLARRLIVERGFKPGVPIEAAIQHAPEIVARDPRDPRGHMFLGFDRVRKIDLAGAEREFRAGLAETEILRANFSGTQVEPPSVRRWVSCCSRRGGATRPRRSCDRSAS